MLFLPRVISAMGHTFKMYFIISVLHAFSSYFNTIFLISILLFFSFGVYFGGKKNSFGVEN